LLFISLGSLIHETVRKLDDVATLSQNILRVREGRPDCSFLLIVDYDVPPFERKFVDLRTQDHSV